MIDRERVIEKLDGYLHKKQFLNAEKHLLYWLNEAKILKDENMILTIYNELIGFYRKQGRKDDCLKVCDEILLIIEKSIYNETVIKATTYINIATGYKSFKKSKEALSYYEKAKEIYEKSLDLNDIRFGALYNNMALAFLDMNEINKAEELFFKALDIMSNDKKNYPEVAVTYCNLCDLEVKKSSIGKAENKINEYLVKAKKYLDEVEKIAEEKNYAFVCEKCADTFAYYGYFLFEKEIRERVNKIYEMA